MSGVDRAALSRLRERLAGLSALLLRQAERDSEFALALEGFLGGGPVPVAAPAKAASRTTRPPEPNIVAVLQDRGPDALRAELEGQTEDHLRLLARFHSVARGKKLKDLNRAALIGELLTAAGQALGRGSAFLGDSRS